MTSLPGYLFFHLHLNHHFQVIRYGIYGPNSSHQCQKQGGPTMGKIVVIAGAIGD